MSALDRLACSPPEDLASYGVTADNADLLRPGKGMLDLWKERVNQMKAERLLHLGGISSAEEMAEVLAAAAKMFKGDRP